MAVHHVGEVRRKSVVDHESGTQRTDDLVPGKDWHGDEVIESLRLDEESTDVAAIEGVDDRLVAGEILAGAHAIAFDAR